MNDLEMDRYIESVLNKAVEDEQAEMISIDLKSILLGSGTILMLMLLIIGLMVLLGNMPPVEPAWTHIGG